MHFNFNLCEAFVSNYRSGQDVAQGRIPFFRRLAYIHCATTERGEIINA